MMDHLLSVLQLLEEKNQFKKVLLRKGGEIGDYIGVTGFIGDAYIGLKILEKKIKISIKTKENKLILFYFLLNFINFLAKLSKYAKSCIDISDGLIEDIKKLADFANCGINLSSKKYHF